MRWMYGYGWGGGFFWLLWLAVLAALAFLVIYAARRGSSPPKESAEQILRERFARGEISKEEYEDRLKTLRKS